MCCGHYRVAVNLPQTLTAIRPIDPVVLAAARAHQDDLIKPQGSLGLLETIGNQLSAISGQVPPPVPERIAVTVFAGDHGVWAQEVSPWPQEVTQQMAGGIAGGMAGISVLARQVGADVRVIDVGVNGDLTESPTLQVRKVGRGTADLSTGAAMTAEQAQQAVETGIAIANELVDAGYQLLIAGEVGIGNTTPAAALVAAMTGGSPAECTGRGTGINDATHSRKCQVVERAIALHQPDPARPMEVLAALGGYEHAAMVGYYLGGAARRVPVVIDGVISASAALIAAALSPTALQYFIAGHYSAEPGSRKALQHLGLVPVVDLGLRLGEGTGAAMAIPAIQAAAKVLHEMATFSGAGVSTRTD